MSRPVLLIVVITLPLVCYGQPDTVSTISMHLPGIKISYTSSLIYPGFSIGAEFMLKTSLVPVTKNDPEKSFVRRNHLISINLNFYHHYGFHDNLFLTGEWTRRRINPGGLYTEFSAGGGYSRTFLAGITYMVANDGTVMIKEHAGYSYALVTAGGGIGYDFYILKKDPWQAFVKMNIIGMFPYDSVIYFRPILEVGTRFSLNTYMDIRHLDKNKNSHNE